MQFVWMVSPAGVWIEFAHSVLVVHCLALEIDTKSIFLTVVTSLGQISLTRDSHVRGGVPLILWCQFRLWFGQSWVGWPFWGGTLLSSLLCMCRLTVIWYLRAAGR